MVWTRYESTFSGSKRAGNPATDFYPQYWKLLEQFDFRFHWGKYSPPRTPPRVSSIAEAVPQVG